MDQREFEYRLRQAETLYSQKKPADALKILDELDRVFPDANNALYTRALCLADLGRGTEALAVSDRLSSVRGDSRGAELRARLEAQGVTPAALPPKIPGVVAQGSGAAWYRGTVIRWAVVPVILCLFGILYVLGPGQCLRRVEEGRPPSVFGPSGLIPNLPEAPAPPAPARSPAAGEYAPGESPRPPSAGRLGTFYFRDEGATEWNRRDGVDAASEVVLPLGKEVMLDTVANADLSKLAALDLARIHGLNLDSVSLSDRRNAEAFVKASEKLVNLRELTLAPLRPVNDNVWACLANYTTLRGLDLSQVQMGDREAGYLKGLRSLRRLDISGTGVGDGGLANLADLTSLESLNLARTRLTDSGLVYLADLVSLRELNLGRTAIRGPGLKHLKGLGSIQKLTLLGSKVEDAGLEYVGELGSLRELDLAHTPVGDAGLAHLTNLTSLERLHLHGTRVTDACLNYLVGLTSLRYINLHGTRVTAAGIRSFREALPELTGVGQPSSQQPLSAPGTSAGDN